MELIYYGVIIFILFILFYYYFMKMRKPEIEVKFSQHPDQNAVSGMVAPGQNTPVVKFYGSTPDPLACQTNCAKDPWCQAYTWHDPNQGEYSNHCYGRDSSYTLTPQGGHYSGARQINT